MATQLVELRPGKWVKVVDGHIVGRATPEEVAAWQQAGRAQGQATADLELDIDLSPKPGTGPAHALDISPRPAFERRRKAGPEAVGGATKAPPRTAPEREGPAGATGKEPGVAKGAVGPAPQPKAARPARREATRQERPQPPAAEAAGPPRPGPLPAPPPEAPAEGTPEPSTARGAQGPSYWWVWNARNQPVAEFLAEWTARYKHKFGRKATLILCHPDDLAAVEACGYNAEVSPLLRPGHFYLTHGEGG